ncbi:MAG: restriction endonuclease subunit S, partial [Candidatus Omnitrophica bacterium]|nr:restriction endonuclease subunit S [Candidatus Omnitrophota bacterium]
MRRSKNLKKYQVFKITPWPRKKLGEICEKIKKEKAPLGTVPYIEIGNIDVESKKINFTDKGAVKGSIFCPENSILISRVRPTRGAIILMDKKIAVSPAFTIIKPKPIIIPKLLFYFLAWNKRFLDYLGSKQKGTNYPSVKESDILDFEISFPENLEIQQKIVSILDTIQSAIDIQNKIIEKTKELKKSMMADLFKYGGPSFRKGRKLKKTEIGEIPENWEVVKLGEVVEEI